MLLFRSFCLTYLVGVSLLWVLFDGFWGGISCASIWYFDGLGWLITLQVLVCLL